MLFNSEATMNFNLNNEPILRCESLIKDNAWIYFENKQTQDIYIKRIKKVEIEKQNIICQFYSGANVEHNGKHFLDQETNPWKAINFIDFRTPNTMFNKGNFCDEALSFILRNVQEKYASKPTNLVLSFEEGCNFNTDTTMFRPCIFPSESTSSKPRILTHWLFERSDKHNGHLILNNQGFPLVATIGQSLNTLTGIYVGTTNGVYIGDTD